MNIDMSDYLTGSILIGSLPANSELTISFTYVLSIQRKNTFPYTKDLPDLSLSSSQHL